MTHGREESRSPSAGPGTGNPLPHPLEVVIVGGGTAGWMTATALATATDRDQCTVTLIESEEIGRVGVGEATLPQIKAFNDYVGIVESDMMRKTNATFKLGIEFRDWGAAHTSYVHPFGVFGTPMGGVDFLHHWVRARNSDKADPIENYSYAIQACRHSRFEFPVADKDEVNSLYGYAYHFDAGLYAEYLRAFAEARGVNRIEGRIVDVQLNGENGHVERVRLKSGEDVYGDYFVDCSGFHALLMDTMLGVPFEDWSRWLPCDRAQAVPSRRVDPLIPHTRATARNAGWQWRIPLQHRTGNGYVYCSDFISDEEAREDLLSAIDGEALDEPRLLRFKAGRRKVSWQGNCISIGLSSGFLEPLESTSIYLIQIGITHLLKLFPHRQPDPRLVREYNRLVDLEYERVRDFLILHYHLNDRQAGELWKHCREMDVPDSLVEKMEMFRRRAYVDEPQYGLFASPSWIAVFLGQGLEPAGYDPFADNLPLEKARSAMQDLAGTIERRVQAMPGHSDFIADYCPAHE